MARFFSVHCHQLPLRPRLHGVCAGYESGKWRADQLSRYLIEWLPEFSLSYTERKSINDTNSVAQIRKAAQASLLDGFTSCLFVSPTGLQTQGTACRTTSQCLPGQLCNEWNVCAAPPRPYNMRLAYRSLRVLTTEWSDELQQAESELAVDAYDRDLDSVAKHDVPVAVEIMNKARFVTLVIDEDPVGGLAKPAAGSMETAEEQLQRLPHFARIGIWDLATRTPLLRLRAEAAADFVAMSGHRATSAETEAALADSPAGQMPLRPGVAVPAGVVPIDQMKPMRVAYPDLAARLPDLTTGFLKAWVDRAS